MEIVPLHSSLGSRARLHLKKKKKEISLSRYEKTRGELLFASENNNNNTNSASGACHIVHCQDVSAVILSLSYVPYKGSIFIIIIITLSFYR